MIFRFEKTRYIAEFSGAGGFLCLLVDILKYAERWKELKRCIATSDTYPGMVLYSAGRSGSVVPFDDRKDETGEGRD